MTIIFWVLVILWVVITLWNNLPQENRPASPYRWVSSFMLEVAIVGLLGIHVFGTVGK